MDEAIIQYIKKKYNLLIGERTAEQIKLEIGSAFPLDEPITMEIKGRDLIEGIPKTLTITDAEIREALAEPISIIVNAVRVALERTPPELSRRHRGPRHRARPAAAACSRTSTSCCARRPACRSRWPRTRCRSVVLGDRQDAFGLRPAPEDQPGLRGP